MSPPLSTDSRPASAPVLTEARPAPFPRWAGAVLSSSMAAGYSLGLDADGFVRFLRDTHALVVGVGALVILLALLSLGRWAHRFMLSRSHPYEPWLWDKTWRRELRDQLMGQVLGGWLLSLVLLTFLAVVHGLAFSELFIQADAVLPGILVGGFLLIFDIVISVKVFQPTVLGTLALLRFGRMRLRLPGVPLELGSWYQVDLVARPSLALLSNVKVELRRIREWTETTGSGENKNTRSMTHTEHSHTYTVDAAALREGRDLAIPLELPEARPENSTMLHGSRRCYWELQISSEVPGVDLDTTFVLPVYYIGG